MPELAKEDSKEGAVAFVKYFIAASNHAQLTGDLQRIESYSSRSCESCRRFGEYVTKVYRSGGSLSGGTWTVKRVLPARLSNGDWLLTAECTFDEQVTLIPGEPKRVSKAGTGRLNFTISRDETWFVASWTRS